MVSEWVTRGVRETFFFLHPIPTDSQSTGIQTNPAHSHSGYCLHQTLTFLDKFTLLCLINELVNLCDPDQDKAGTDEQMHHIHFQVDSFFLSGKLPMFILHLTQYNQISK